MVAFCGRILALGRWNLQMSWCKYPGVPRGPPPGMAADKCISSEFVLSKYMTIDPLRAKSLRHNSVPA